MNPDLKESIFLITSSDSSNSRFGTGFSIRQNSDSIYVLTCNHVLTDVGGIDKVLVNRFPATLVASGQEDGIDLAVLRIEGLFDKPAFNLSITNEENMNCITAGFQVLSKKDKTHLIRQLKCKLGKRIGLPSKESGDLIPAWDLIVIDDYTLEPGYSGSPIINEETGEVLGVVSHREGKGERGLVISIQALDKFWKTLSSEQWYSSLKQIGYREQDDLFLDCTDENSIAAFLIHGQPNYGQLWLLGKLVSEGIPERHIRKINLSRKVRKGDINSLWRELGRWVGLPPSSQASKEKIIEKICCWLKTQNVALIFHEVDGLLEETFIELVSNFWQPLALKAEELLAGKCSNKKLVMFLVDYEGCVGRWKASWAEELDGWESIIPIKLPKISEFSEQDLRNWSRENRRDLPCEFTRNTIKSILAEDNGIPEPTLYSICNLSGFDWNEESNRWLNYLTV